jgi:hypothetical protein
MLAYRVIVRHKADRLLAEVADIAGVQVVADDHTTIDRYVREAIAAVLELPIGMDDRLVLEYDYRAAE